jgi:hypothetical protein
MRRSNRVRDAGVAGSNPATPTRLLLASDPYRDSYRDRNGSATGNAPTFALDNRLSETCPPTLLGPFQKILLIIEPVNRRGLFLARIAANFRVVLCRSCQPFVDAASPLRLMRWSRSRCARLGRRHGESAIMRLSPDTRNPTTGADGRADHVGQIFPSNPHGRAVWPHK